MNNSSLSLQRNALPGESTASKLKLSIVVPCFNEGEAISHLAETLVGFVEDHPQLDVEVVLVDDGSSDDTWETMLDNFSGWDNCVLLQHQQNRGLMAAILTGAQASSNEIICSMDSDCTYHPDGIPQMLEALGPEVAVVTSSPYHPQGAVVNVPNWRIQLSRMASRMYRLVFRNKLYCYTCCFRLFRKSVVEKMELKNSGYVGTVEFLWFSDCLGQKIVEVPATLNVRKFGQSKCKVLSVMWKHARFWAKLVVSSFLKLSSRHRPSVHPSRSPQSL